MEKDPKDFYKMMMPKYIQEKYPGVPLGFVPLCGGKPIEKEEKDEYKERDEGTIEEDS